MLANSQCCSTTGHEFDTRSAQAPAPVVAAQPSWGEPVPVQTPTSGVSLTLALVGPNSAALTPSDRAAIQAAMAQAIPGISARPFLNPCCCHIP